MNDDRDRQLVQIQEVHIHELLSYVESLKTEANCLKTAIRAHRDKCGDDRCWIDDHELYSVLGEPFDTHTKNLPCREEFLVSCERYWRQRQPTGTPITEHPPDPEDMSDPGTLTIGQLERENVRLRRENERLSPVRDIPSLAEYEKLRKGSPLEES